MTFGGRRFLFCAGGFFRFFPLSPLLVKQQKITQVRTMRTTRPTRPATRYVPTPPESDIFGGPCPLTACPSLPAPPWLHVGVVGAHPGRSSSPPHPALWRVYQLVGSRGGTRATASRPNIPRCTKSLADNYRCVAGCPKNVEKLEQLVCTIGNSTVNWRASFVM